MAIETISYDNLIAGDFPVVTEKVTIASGEGVLSRGTILGIEAESGKYVAADSSTDPKAILLNDVDATSADVANADVALTGEFNSAELKAKTGSTVADLKAGLRAVSIFVKEVI